MSTSFFFVILALGVALAAFLIRRRPGDDAEDGGARADPTEDAEAKEDPPENADFPPDENYVEWNECQRQLRAAPPIAECDFIEMPPVDPARMEEAGPEGLDERAPLGGGAMILIVLMAVGAAGNGASLVEYAEAIVNLLRDPETAWSSGALLRMVLPALLTLAVTVSQVSIIVCAICRSARMRGWYYALCAAILVIQVYDLILYRDAGRFVRNMAGLALLYGSFFSVLFQSRRARASAGAGRRGGNG